MTPRRTVKLPAGMPERIYLQLGNEDIEPSAKFSDYGDVTWCADKIDENDVEYVRADIVRAERKRRKL